MAEEGMFNDALTGIVAIIEDVSDDIAKEFKGKKPFDKEPVKDEDLLYDYNTKGFEIFKNIYDTQGEEVARDYINQMDNLKLKFGGRNAQRI